MAQQIIDLAKENNIQIQEDSALVSNLLDMDLGDNIPPQLYSVMAEILLLIEEMDKKLLNKIRRQSDKNKEAIRRCTHRVRLLNRRNHL